MHTHKYLTATATAKLDKEGAGMGCGKITVTLRFHCSLSYHIKVAKLSREIKTLFIVFGYNKLSHYRTNHN
jgi:hypothetical protein